MFSKKLICAFEKAHTAKPITGREYGPTRFYSLPKSKGVLFTLRGELKYPLELKSWDDNSQTLGLVADLTDGPDPLIREYATACDEISGLLGIVGAEPVDKYFSHGDDAFRLSIKFDGSGKLKAPETCKFVDVSDRIIPYSTILPGHKIELRLCCDSVCVYEHDGEQHLKLVMRLLRVIDLDQGGLEAEESEEEEEKPSPPAKKGKARKVVPTAPVKKPRNT